MPPSRPSAPVPGLLVAPLAALLAGVVAGCSTSAPARVDAPPSATAALTPSASPTDVLSPTDAPSGGVVGALADGFPVDLVPVPAGAEVLVSSAEPVTGTDLVTISLNVRSDLDVAALVAAVHDPLVAAGFAETAGAVPQGLAAQSTFSRSDGAELLVLGVVDDGDARTLTVGGTVRTTAP